MLVIVLYRLAGVLGVRQLLLLATIATTLSALAHT